jgi:hypothetical protein
MVSGQQQSPTQAEAVAEADCQAHHPETEPAVVAALAVISMR